MIMAMHNIESFVFDRIQDNSGNERIEEKVFYNGQDLYSQGTLILNDASEHLLCTQN